MTNDETVKARIKENYRSRPWYGVVPVEQAIAAAIDYRERLSDNDRKLFDEAILDGWLPERAVEMVEFASGRDDRLSVVGKKPVKVS